MAEPSDAQTPRQTGFGAPGTDLTQPGTFGFGRPKATPQEVAFFHEGADTDQGAGAKHHTLGTRAGQAFPGEQGRSLQDEVASIQDEVEGIGESVSSLHGRNRFRNPDFRVNQRGYVSGAALPPQQYGPDGWCASGVVNLVPNPSLESTATPWINTSSTHSVARSTAQAFSGSASLACTTISSGGTGAYVNSSLAAIAEHETLTASVYLRASVAGKTGKLEIRWLNAGGGFISVSSVTGVPITDSGWTRLSLTGVAPSTAAGVSILFQMESATAGQIVYADAMMLVRGDWSANLPDYFDGSLAGCMWTGTAHASTSYNVSAAPTLILPTAAQGGLATLSSGGRIFQAIERADVGAGTWTLAHEGTAEVRVYNADTAEGSRPAFAASPVQFTADGLDDVIVEFQATGGTATVGNVTFVPGSVAQSYAARVLGEETAWCERHYQRIAPGAIDIMIAVGSQQSTTTWQCVLPLPTRMRARPVVTFSGIQWTDATNFGADATLTSVQSNNDTASAVSLRGTIAANGASLRPGFLRQNSTTSYVELDAEIRKYAA